MTYTDDRQAGDEKKEDVPQIEVTPEMIPEDALDVGFASLLRAGAYEGNFTDYAEAVAETVSALAARGWLVCLSEPEAPQSNRAASESCSGRTPLASLVAARLSAAS